MTFFAQELFAITLYLCSHRQNTLGILVKLIDGYMDGPVNEPSNDCIQIFERQWLYPSQMCILDLLARPKASRGEGNGTPLQYPCLENPMDGGAWWAAVHGVAKSRTRLSDFTFTFHFHALERKWQPTPVFLPGESQGWGSLVGCHLWGRRVGHDWSDLAAAAAAKLPGFCKHIFPIELSHLWATVTLALKWSRGSTSLEGKSIILGKATGGYDSTSRFTVKLMMPKHWDPPPSHRPLPRPTRSPSDGFTWLLLLYDLPK